jgi:hypothetical protein
MNKIQTLLVTAALLASGLYAAAAVAGDHGSAQSGHVTICHRTGSRHNPYVVISPSAAGVYHGHYSQHNEHAVFPNTASDGKWGDIIPPFQYNGVTYSLNWNAAGQAIWSNGCAAAPTGGTTTAPGGTTTAPGSTTVTTSGGTTTVTTPVGTTTVTTPGATTTVTTPGATTTVTTPGGTTTVTTPTRPHHKKKHHRQTFTPPKIKLPHTM